MTDPATYIEGRTVQEQMNSLIGYVDTRSAEVALDAIAADVAQVASDKADAHADALAAAASAAAAAGTLANAVKKTGEASQNIAGDIAVSGDLDVGGDADVTGDTIVGGALDVTGAITGNDASLIGTVTVPTETTGQFTMKSANSTKVKNELDNYAPMVRTTGNQTVAGKKTFATPLQVRLAANIMTDTNIGANYEIVDSNDVVVQTIRRYRGTSEDYSQWTMTSWIYTNYKVETLLRMTTATDGTVTLKLFKIVTDLNTQTSTTTSTTVATL